MIRLFAAFLVFLLPLTGQAEEWKFSLSPYLWLPSVSLDSSEIDDGDSPGDGSGVEIGPVDYLDALDFALMMAGDVRKGDWVFMADLLYVDFSIDNEDIRLRRPNSGPLSGTYFAGLSGSIFSLSGGRSLLGTDTHQVDAVLGWRRFNLTLELEGNLDSGERLDLENALEFNDAFIGVNGRYALGNGEKWTLRYYADIGGGQSDLTWQASIGLGLAFGWGELFLDYRHLDYDFGDNKELQEVTGFLRGPAFGATFRF